MLYNMLNLIINAVMMLQKKGEPAMNSITIGMDLGDKTNFVCVEAGTNSPWISRLLESTGCNVLVGKPRKTAINMGE